MAVLPIRLANDPILRQRAKKVHNIDASIQRLIDDMIETMRDAPGVGLAANQVGVALRVIVIEVPDVTEEEDDETPDDNGTDGDDDETPEDNGTDGDDEAAPVRPEGWTLYTVINPQIVKRSGERTLDEGCLSLPGYLGPTPRSVKVTVKGQDRDGKQIRIKAENNLLAEVLEHEIDHINGSLYIDRLESPDQLVRLDDEPDDQPSEEEAEAR